MLVSEVMTSPALTVRADTPLREALLLLDQHGITMLPVVGTAGEIVGVLSEADVVRTVVPQNVGGAPDDTAVGPSASRHSVADLMTRDAVTVPASSEVSSVARLMTDTAVKSVPVVDPAGQVVGVISRRDIVHLLARTDTEIVRDLDDLFRRIGTDWTISVRDGVVTVSGPILPNETAVAEAAVRTVLGVRSVTVVPD